MVDRAPFGLLISALGAAVLAVSVFGPWYGVSINASGAAAARQELAFVAEQYGNTNFVTRANQIGAQFRSLAGRPVATVDARQALKHLSGILLALAGVALLASLFRLAGLRGLLMATGGQIALAGGLAAGLVVYRILWRPKVSADFVSLSLGWGIWLALGSAATVFAGGLVAGRARARSRTTSKLGPGPPPIGREVASARAVSRVRP